MKKEFTNLKDFIEDVSFKRWIVEKSEQDKLKWEEWLIHHPEKETLVEDAANILTGIQFNAILPSSNKVEKELEKLHLSIAAKETANKQSKQMYSGLRRNSLLAMAAAIALVLAVTFVIPYFLQDSMVEHRTAFGQFEQIQLPDGSKVVLNANSILKYEATTPRKVWLEGEAFFEVTKKPRTQENFQVQTNDLTVKVLGTTFNVNSRNAQTKVFLEEGKITLELDEKKEQIEPGEFISYSQEKKEIINRYKKEEEIHSNWKDGVLKINNASMKDILKEIESIYGIDLIVNNTELLQKEGSVAVPVNDLDMATAILERMLNVKIESKGKQYFVK